MTANRLWRVYAQTFASVTLMTVDLYSDGGVPRLVLQGWPCRGSYLATFNPQKSKE